MYTKQDAAQLFIGRGEFEAKIKMLQAQYHKREEEMPGDIKRQIEDCERKLLEIDGVFSLFSSNEAFVIRHHLVEGLDWEQVSLKYVAVWGTASEKTIRSFQLWQTKALRKVACVLNNTKSTSFGAQ